MYIPKHFAQAEDEQLFALMQANPFATLITNGDQRGLRADHLPIVTSYSQADGFTFQGHIAKANLLWQELDNANVLLIFHGPQAYVSPNAYPSKKHDARVVPTWNYATVHVRGKVTFVHDSCWKREFLTKLVDVHEAAYNQPWKIEDAPADFIGKLTDAIVGFEIATDNIQGKRKLSQNQPKENRAGVITDLLNRGSGQDQATATLMQFALKPDIRELRGTNGINPDYDHKNSR